MTCQKVLSSVKVKHINSESEKVKNSTVNIFNPDQTGGRTDVIRPHVF